MDDTYDSVLGQRLAVCKPSGGTLFIFAIPGLIAAFWLVAGFKIALEMGNLTDSGNVKMFCILALITVLLFAPVVLRVKDKAELYEKGFRFNGQEFLLAECGDFTIQHQGSAYIRLLDKTVVRFQYQGGTVRLATRTLRDFSAQLRRCYGGGGV